MPVITEKWLSDCGFAEVPEYLEASGTENLYRVFGGATSQIIGQCYSFENPATVSAAEFDSNIVKWGNLCLYVAHFKPSKGTPMYYGRIDQSYSMKNEGDGVERFMGGKADAKQIWIDPKRAITSLILVGEPRRLIQDKVVMSHAGNA